MTTRNILFYAILWVAKEIQDENCCSKGVRNVKGHNIFCGPSQSYKIKANKTTAAFVQSGRNRKDLS